MPLTLWADWPVSGSSATGAQEEEDGGSNEFHIGVF